MSILCDSQIRNLCLNTHPPMISPFIGSQTKIVDKPASLNSTVHYLEAIRLGKTNPLGTFPVGTWYDLDNGELMIPEKVISYGLSSYGYDVRLSDEFKIFTNINSVMIDPLNFDQKCCFDHKGDYCIIPPNSYILGKTIEYFTIPRDISVICVGKSTYARAGAIVNVTPIEAGFEGNIVIEISNATSLPLKVYANMGISQFIFFKGNIPCSISYADRKGKYQNQTTVQTSLA